MDLEIEEIYKLCAEHNVYVRKGHLEEAKFNQPRYNLSKTKRFFEFYDSIKPGNLYYYHSFFIRSSSKRIVFILEKGNIVGTPETFSLCFKMKVLDKDKITDMVFQSGWDSSSLFDFTRYSFEELK